MQIEQHSLVVAVLAVEVVVDVAGEGVVVGFGAAASHADHKVGCEGEEVVVNKELLSGSPSKVSYGARGDEWLYE